MMIALVLLVAIIAMTIVMHWRFPLHSETAMVYLLIGGISCIAAMEHPKVGVAVAWFITVIEALHLYSLFREEKRR